MHERITDQEFQLLAGYIKDHSGIHLKDEKKTLVVGRLSSRLNELHISDFMTYYQLLKMDKDGQELSFLIDKITTNHTYFMRESEHFNYLNEQVLPWIKTTVKDRDMRIWCAASSSGEEPYTLAILLEEFFGREFPKWDKKLLATDLSLTVLEKARQGIYSSEQVSVLPKMWLMHYFEKRGAHYHVKDHLKNQVIYRRFNLLEPTYPFKKKFHVIFCRNVLIYFDGPTKEAIIEKMRKSLEPGGYLFIGHSETINRDKSTLTYIKPAVYRNL